MKSAGSLTPHWKSSSPKVVGGIGPRGFCGGVRAGPGAGAPDRRRDEGVCRRVEDVFVRLLDEGLVVAVHVRQVVALVALPEELARLLVCKLADLLEEVVVMTRVARVGFPVPDVVEFGVGQAEPLQAHKLLPVHLPIHDFGIPAREDGFGPEHGDVAKFHRYVLSQHLII